MAAKSLLHQFGWRRGEYKVGKVAASWTSKSVTMEGSFRKQGNSGDEPPPKKRKTEEEDKKESDELWDDSMEFTQADLDDIEMQASQAITHTKPEVAGTETGIDIQVATVSGQTQATFLKPKLARLSSSSTSSSVNGGSRSVRSSPGYSSHNSSHGSSHSMSHSSHSSYPGSLSGYSNTSSSSVRSGSSAENATSRTLSRLSSGSLDISGVMLSGSQTSMADINKIKQECAALKLQVENMKQEVCVKDGENRLLRDNLTQKEAELDTIKTEKISQIHQQNVQQSEKEKSLQVELSRLQTQLQFKEQEERERTLKIKELETQLKGQQLARPSSSQAFPQSQSVSPKPIRVPVEERSPKGHGGFPSKKTFMASEVSPVKRIHVTKTGDNQESVTATNIQAETAVSYEKGRKQSGLKLAVSGCRSSGSQLVDRLLSIAPSTRGSMSERGILGLLNTPSTSASLFNIQFDRDKDTSLLSPVRGRRLSDLQSFVTQIDKPDMVSLVPVDHFNMAVQGLSNLLKPRNQSDSDKRSDLSIQTQMRCPDGIEGATYSTNLDDAILILPLISDYLRHYTEMIESKFENSATSSNSTSSSSPDSFDTSSESPTGSLGQFLKSSANHANDLESLTIASLHTLHTLLSCVGVRRILLDVEVNQSPKGTEVAEIEETSVKNHSSNILSVEEKQKKLYSVLHITPKRTISSNSETDLPIKESSSKTTHIPQKYIVKLNILRKVIKLSNPGAKGRTYNSRIVTACLNILTVLATYATDQQMKSLVPVLSEECLQNCMEVEGDPNIVVHALQLFKALLKSNHLVSSLCSNTTGCVLLTTYSLCSPERWLNVSVASRLNIANMIVESIFYLASSHKGCFTLVLESDCQCSVEIVKCIVNLLHSVMKLHKNSKINIKKFSSLTCSDQSEQSLDSIDSLLYQEEHHQRTCLKILQTGLQLLHLMSQFDTEFTTRHIPVQHRYVGLICGLTHIFRHGQSGDSENEMNALQDLWDFNQDDSELSQDSDTDEQESMDNT